MMNPESAVAGPARGPGPFGPLPPGPPRSTAGWQIAGHRILVVDDEASIRALLTGFGESLGCQVYVSADAEGALRVLRVRPVDLVLVDMRMPERDGSWLIEQIYAHWPTLPIVIATGVAELDPQVTLRPGVAGYVLKPFDFAELQDAIEHALKPGQDPSAQ